MPTAGQAAPGCFYHTKNNTLKYIRKLGGAGGVKQKDFHGVLPLKLNVAIVLKE